MLAHPTHIVQYMYKFPWDEYFAIAPYMKVFAIIYYNIIFVRAFLACIHSHNYITMYVACGVCMNAYLPMFQATLGNLIYNGYKNGFHLTPYGTQTISINTVTVKTNVY